MITIRLEHGVDKYTKEPNAFNVKFIAAGYRVLEENGTLKPRFLDRHEMLFVAKGNLLVQAGGAEYAISANELMLLPPYQILSCRNGGKDAAAYYWLRLTAERLEPGWLSRRIAGLRNPHDYLKCFKELAYTPQAAGLPVYTNDVIAALLLCNLAADGNRQERSNRIDTLGILEWIHEHAGAGLSVQAVSDAFNYHKDYLGKIFKAEVGATLKETINSAQLKKAKELLTTTDYSVKRIAELLQYEDANLFIKFFTYHERMGPGRFRSLHAGTIV